MEIANIAAGGGVEALFVVQDKGTSTGSMAIMVRRRCWSCATTRIFGLGRADDTTAGWAAKQLPVRTAVTRSRSYHATRDSVSYSEAHIPMMDGPQIQEMPIDQMLCLIRSNPPLLLDRIISHEHRDYGRKLDPNPVLRA